MSDVVSGFTFHNVSINSKEWPEIEICTAVFTFHNVSINSLQYSVFFADILYLHSIMYLLIPYPKISAKLLRLLFTFHNVSINSLWILFPPVRSCTYLHSIMYLLIHLQRQENRLNSSIYIP